MSVELAKSAGFCYGVKRAVEMAEQAARSGGAVLLGPVIHNDHVVSKLEREGAVLVRTVEEVPPGAAVILRSHGEARRVHEALAEKGCRIVDTACPNVQRIHRLVAEAEEAGRAACRAALAGESGKMVTFIRNKSVPYELSYGTADVNIICNKEKGVPMEWITNLK